MPQSFTFLMAPLEAVGHFNACIGIGQQLLKRGHKIIFATPNSFRGKLATFGFREEYYQDLSADGSEDFGDIVAAMAPAMALPSIEKMETLYVALYREAVRKTKDSDSKLREIMCRIQPDVVVVDNAIRVPALMDAGVPWICSCSYCPLGTYVCKKLPPGFAGYSIFDGNNDAWNKYGERHRLAFHDLFENFKTWVVEKGGPELEYRVSPLWYIESPYGNIGMYPEEMSYNMHVGDRSNWHQVDSLIRKEKGSFEIPAKLNSLQGKLIYFSMGTIGSCELGLMRRLVGFLSKSPNRFIVSKGPLGDKLELADNMWGSNDLPQTLIIPKVDLVITHGGNNTITESFYFGKPVLVLPLFADQLDNGARVHETGHGIQFQPYDVTETELLDGVKLLLNDKLLKKRMIAIGTRIRASNSQERAADVVESVAQKYSVLQ